MNRLRTLLLTSATITGMAALAVGYTTSHPNKQALVCPDCKVVIEEQRFSSGVPEGAADDAVEIRTIVRHSCPGCQGAFTTLLKEGRLLHRCSICETEGFSCPVIHR